MDCGRKRSSSQRGSERGPGSKCPISKVYGVVNFLKHSGPIIWDVYSSSLVLGPSKILTYLHLDFKLITWSLICNQEPGLIEQSLEVVFMTRSFPTCAKITS